MGEAQGDPPRQVALASAGAGVPTGVQNPFSTVNTVTAREAYTGASTLASPTTLFFSTKIAYSGATCVFPRGQQFSGVVPGAHRGSDFRRKYVYNLSAAERYTYLR